MIKQRRKCNPTKTPAALQPGYRPTFFPRGKKLVILAENRVKGYAPSLSRPKLLFLAEQNIFSLMLPSGFWGCIHVYIQSHQKDT